MVNIWNICLTHDPAFGGLYRGINDFAEALDALILSFDDGQRDRSGLPDRAVRVPCGTWFLSRDCHHMPRAAAKRAEEVIADADLLIVHSLFGAHTVWAASWARRHGKPYWVVPHGCLDPWSLGQKQLAKKTWLAAVGKRYLARARRIVFSTQKGLEKAAGWVPPGTGATMHWPVTMPKDSEKAVSRASFRKKHGIPGDASMLLFVGRLHAVKRPLLVIEAFCDVASGRPHLVIVGMDDTMTAKEVARAVPVGHRKRVHLVGGLAGDELAEAYRAADGFISLSFQENFGYAAAEAIAYGLPVILSPGHDLAYDLPRTATGGIACGWLLPDNTTATAAAAIKEWARLVSSQSATGAEMGEVGRAWAGTALSQERFRTSLRELL